MYNKINIGPKNQVLVISFGKKESWKRRLDPFLVNVIYVYWLCVCVCVFVFEIFARLVVYTMLVLSF